MDPLIQALNLLSADPDPARWVQGFSDFITTWLPEIDHVTVLWPSQPWQHEDWWDAFDALAAISHNATTPPFLAFTSGGGVRAHLNAHSSHGHHSPDALWEQAVPHAIMRTFSASEHVVVTVLLWGHTGGPPLSQSALQEFDAAKTFVGGWLRNAIARTENDHSSEIALYHGVTKATRIGKLTQQETKVTALLLSGFNYATIARALGVGVHMAKKHASNIYMKLRVGNHSELILRYLAPQCMKNLYERLRQRGGDALGATNGTTAAEP